MAPRKHPGRCGCERSWTFPDAQENPSCCEHALTAPCWYVMSFECGSYTARYSDATLGNVREPLLGNVRTLQSGGGCHFLRKECITGCSWGDRWASLDNFSSPEYDYPLVEIGNCPTSVVCSDVTDPPDVDLTNLTTFLDELFPGRDASCQPCDMPFYTGGTECVECSWANECAGGEFTESGIQQCRTGIGGDHFFLRKKWEMLMISPTEATLTCTSAMGWVSQYYCGNFNPRNKSTFIRNEAAVHEKLVGLPVRICVIPISRTVLNPCETSADLCACNDPGFCSATIWVQISGCAGFSGRQTLGITRMYSVPAGLSGVSMPSPAPCGFFWGTVGLGDVSCSGYKNQLGIQLWCDGTTYQIAVYCLKTDDTWEAVSGAAITNIIPTCFGPELWFTIPEMPCCCPTSGPTTCDELTALGVPIVADDGTNQITLTYDSGLGYWTYSGAGTFAGCVDGSWVWQCVASDPIEGYFAHSPSGQTCAPAGTLSPFDFSCTFYGCDAGVYSVTFTE